jgi:hypothetical protein
VQTPKANEKLVTLSIVAAIHVIGIYALVSGLAAIFVKYLPARLGAYDVKTEMPLEPLPPLPRLTPKAAVPQSSPPND